MKLKKIASLALAGVMAVSMLAGCKSGANSGNDNNGENGGETVVTSTPVVDAVNKGQSASNAAKVNFTVDSKLDAALQKAVEVYGNDAIQTGVKDAIVRVTGLKNETCGLAGNEEITTGIFKGFLSEDANYTYIRETLDKNLDGKVYTVFDVVVIPGGIYTEEAALNEVATTMDKAIATLGGHSLTAGTKAGDKYYSYSYDGNISMISAKQLDGTTTYYVAYVVNQHVAESTMD